MAIANKLPGVLITSGTGVNTLGVIRCFGRRGIPVTYIDSGESSLPSSSKYITRRLKVPRSTLSENEFIELLLMYGREVDHRMMIVPTGDEDVLTLAKYKPVLETTFILPIPSFSIVNKLVNKKEFYTALAEMNIPHPKTYFPENLEQLRVMGKEVGYPYIIKPSFSMSFLKRFKRKSMVVTSYHELDQAIELLKPSGIEVMLQEIIPGADFYECYSYLDRKSTPLAVCGWHKIRHYPPDFGSGSCCLSAWQAPEIERCLNLLKAIGYYGFANPELKKDPRDGTYKLLEINARTTLQNRLAAACGVDIEYIAYLDAHHHASHSAITPANNIIWVDDFVDWASLFIQYRRKTISFIEATRSLIAKKVHSVVAWDDPIPAIVQLFHLSVSLLNLLCTTIVRRFATNPKRQKST